MHIAVLIFNRSCRRKGVMLMAGWQQKVADRPDLKSWIGDDTWCLGRGLLGCLDSRAQ